MLPRKALSNLHLQINLKVCVSPLFFPANVPLFLLKISFFIYSLGHQDIVNMAFILNEEEGGVISISDDKTVRIWLKRENGNYWPSVCHIMPAPASAMDLDQSSRRLFVGTELGGITEFTIADDLNKLTAERSFPAHQMRVTAITYVPELNVLLSVSKDKSFHYYCTQTTRKLGEFIVPAAATSLQ